MAGRRTPYIEDIIAGLKTVEGRLNRDKFSRYRPGDLVYLREDRVLADGNVVEIPNRILVSITRVDVYATFAGMLAQVGLAPVLPRAKSFATAVSEYQAIYTDADEANYGVLAIHFEVVMVNPPPPA